MASFLVWSCHAPVMRAWRWIMAIAIFFFFFFFLHCLADHLLLQLTCEWSWWPRWLTPGEAESGKSCERWRETERESKRPRPTCTTWACNHTHTNAHCTVFPHCSQWLSSAYFGLKHLLPRRDATFMQHKAVISFWVQELLARRWHGVPGADRCCHPNSAARPPTRQELSARAAEDPGLCWERDPNLALTTAPITGADLIVSLLGEKKKEFGGNRSAWLQSSMKPWTRYLLLHLQLNTSLKSLLNLQ